MIKFSTSPAIIRKTFWEILLTNGWWGNLSLLFAIIICLVFVFLSVFSVLNTGSFKAWPLVLLALSVLLSISLFSSISIFWGKANGFFAENPFTDVELDLQENQVEVRLDGELTVLPWTSVALLRQASGMIILEFEGLLCIGIPRQFVNADDMNLIRVKVEKLSNG